MDTEWTLWGEVACFRPVLPRTAVGRSGRFSALPLGNLRLAEPEGRPRQSIHGVVTRWSVGGRRVGTRWAGQGADGRHGVVLSGL